MSKCFYYLVSWKFDNKGQPYLFTPAQTDTIPQYFQPRKRQKTTDTVPPDLSQPKAPS